FFSSFTRDPAGFSTTDNNIAANLIIFLKGFLKQYPAFEKTPFWIFCESYGGKMTSILGQILDKAIANNELRMNFKGVGLGDSWIDPVECMYSYSPYLMALSEV